MFVKTLHSILALITLVLLCSGARCTASKTVATVGSYTITQKDVDQRNEVIRVYYPQETRSLGLNQLKDAYLYAEILRNHGLPVTDAKLATESARIDKQSLFPETLAKIKNIFQGDHTAYERVFVLPIYVERVLPFEFFPNDAAAQADMENVARKFLAAAQQGDTSFAALAKARGLVMSRFTVSLREGLQQERADASPADPKSAPHLNSADNVPHAVREAMTQQQKKEVSEDGKRWIEEIIKPQRPGTLIPKILNLGSNWLVARYVKPAPNAPDTYALEGVLFPKADFRVWLEQEKRKIRVSPED